MPIRSFVLLPLAGLAMSSAACHDASAPSDVIPTGKLTPAAWANNAGGATIQRFNNVVVIFVFDAERQLLSAHMPSNICGDGQFNVVEVMRVLTPSDVNSVFAKLTSDESQVSVYHATSPADAGLAVQPIDFLGFQQIVDIPTFCAFMSGPNLIAEGTVRRISTFSAASFHARWTGTIQGVDGLDYHLTENYHLNADAHDPNNPATFVQHMADIRLVPLR